MPFLTNLVASSKAPLYVAEYGGDTLAGLSTIANWVGTNDAGPVVLAPLAKGNQSGSLGTSKLGAGTEVTLENTSLDPWDDRLGAYRTFWVFLDDASDLASVELRIGSSPTDYDQFTVDASLTPTPFTDGWNLVRVSRAAIQPPGHSWTFAGVPHRPVFVYGRVQLTFNTGASTVADIRISNLAARPFRVSTGRLPQGTALAPTKEGTLLIPEIGQHRTSPKNGTLTGPNAKLTVVDDGGDGLDWGCPFGDPWSEDAWLIHDFRKRAYDGRQVSLDLGFRTEPELPVNFQPIFRGFISKIKHIGRTWEMPVEDNLRLFRVSFANNATELAPLVLTGNVLDVFLQLLLSTGTGANDATFDVLAAGDGAGVDADLVDIQEILEERDDWLPLDDVRFEFDEPQEDLLAWFFKQVCLPHGIVPKVKGDGRLSVAAVHPAFGGLLLDSIVPGEVLNRSLPGFEQDRENVVNVIQFRFDYDLADDEFDQNERYVNEESLERYGERPLPIESRGIRDAIIAERAAQRILTRLGDGAPPIDVDVQFSKQPLELGDLVQLTMPRIIPDLDRATYGIDGALVEVDGRGLNPRTGRCRLRLGVTGFRQGRFAVISNIPHDSDAATPDELIRWAWIGNAQNQVCDSLGQLFEGWVIGPG